MAAKKPPSKRHLDPARWRAHAAALDDLIADAEMYGRDVGGDASTFVAWARELRAQADQIIGG